MTRKLFPLVLVAVLVLVTANAWWALQSVRKLGENAYWVAHSWQVVHQVERVLGSAVDAETAERGFVPTGEDTYLEPFKLIRRDLPGELDHLQALVSDNPLQVEQTKRLRHAINERMAVLQSAIEARQHGNPNLLRMTEISGSGKVEMDHIRALCDAMEAEEDRLLVVRSASTASSMRGAEFTVAAASILDLLLILFAFWQYAHERHLRVSAEATGEKLRIAQQETEAAAQEIRQLNETLEERVRIRTAELERINRELEAFSYSVSHDLRAPLRTIDGFSLALQEDYADTIDDDGRDYINRVRGGVQRMGTLIDALLQLSRITRTEIVREDFDMSVLATSVASEILDQNRDRDLIIDVQPGLSVNADPRLARVALENLMGNAAKFTSKLEHARVAFGWDDSQQAWFVRDNGAGFDMTYADKLFSAFNRLHGDKDFKGSGIGLATVARVIHRHHGQIWAKSEVNAGATFWFTLGDPDAHGVDG